MNFKKDKKSKGKQKTQQNRQKTKMIPLKNKNVTLTLAENFGQQQSVIQFEN